MKYKLRLFISSRTSYCFKIKNYGRRSDIKNIPYFDNKSNPLILSLLSCKLLQSKIIKHIDLYIGTISNYKIEIVE